MYGETTSCVMLSFRFISSSALPTHPLSYFQLEIVAQEEPGDLKKQLRVSFADELGVDEGGVSKEFYQLITQELCNPDYGMFVYNEETRLFWFNPTCGDAQQEYTLIGILFGLAIYNSIIVDVRFPLLLYRKLLGKLGGFSDLQQQDPVSQSDKEYIAV